MRKYFQLLTILIAVIFWQLGIAQNKAGKFSTVPQYYSFTNQKQVSVSEWPQWMNSQFKLPSGNGFLLLSVEKDNLGMVHYRYRQTMNGIPVEGTMYLLHTKNGLVHSMSGDMVDKIEAPFKAEITETAAISSALANVDAQKYKWQSSIAEEALKENTGDPSATYYPQPQLVYVAKQNKLNSQIFRLAYKMDVYSIQPFSRNYVFVDAVTGEVIDKRNRIHHADVLATAHTQYSGTQMITTDSYNGSYRLREAVRGNGIRTYNAQQSTNPGNIDFTNATTDWNNVNANKDEYATDAHFASEATYDFYKNNFNRNSLDDNGMTLVAYVHYDQDLDNAFWDGGSMNYGDGSVANGTTPYTTLDVGGHEITHGLTQFTADLDYQDESGALNESFSDCMGACIRQSVKQFPANQAALIYLIGDDNGTPFRSMKNPKTYGQPDTYGGQYWYTGTGDDGGVHTNSGVQNHWFYIVAQGESGTNDSGHVYNVSGIGLDKAQQITYRTLTVYLTNTSQYTDARFYSIKAAEDLFGFCSPEVQTVTNAWYAVGVGPQFSATVTTEFSAPVTTACSVPAQIQFSDASTNANYFSWDFGDGGTSNLQNPTYTYTTYGDFSVKLMSWSPDCGADSVVKTQWIHIEDNRPSATDTSVCSNTAAALSATGTGTINWYDSATGGAILNTGSIFNTPAIIQPTTYYIENLIPGLTGTAGPADASIGSGSYNNYAHYTIFNCTVPQTLLSVLVDAGTGGNRTIQLRDAANTVLETVTVNLAQGQQTVPLNFNLPVQNGLRLGIWSGTAGLYRNSSGANYPYVSSDGSITITGNDVPDLDRFYFFYNWQLQQHPCVSERVPVTVDTLAVGCTTDIFSLNNADKFVLSPNPTGNTLQLTFTASQQSNLQYSIRNTLGETVFSERAICNVGSNNKSFDVSSLATGIYFLSFSNEKETRSKRFVKE